MQRHRLAGSVHGGAAAGAVGVDDLVSLLAVAALVLNCDADDGPRAGNRGLTALAWVRTPGGQSLDPRVPGRAEEGVHGRAEGAVGKATTSSDRPCNPSLALSLIHI